MDLPKITLFDMAEAIGDAARGHRAVADRWDRDHPDDPLPPTDRWALRARVFETAHLTLSLMALDEDASRKLVASLMATKDGRTLSAMLTPVKPKATAEPIEAAA